MTAAQQKAQGRYRQVSFPGTGGANQQQTRLRGARIAPGIRAYRKHDIGEATLRRRVVLWQTEVLKRGLRVVQGDLRIPFEELRLLFSNAGTAIRNFNAVAFGDGPAGATAEWAIRFGHALTVLR